MLAPLELTGRTNRHIRTLAGFDCGAHVAVCAPFLELRRAATRDGIDVCAWSAFRSFDDQLRIWNAKYRGDRALYAPDGSRLDHSSLDERTLIEAILRWSALPGASRHHWGTDIDVIDRAALPPGYEVRLMPDEFEAGGVFERLGRWLDAHLGAHDFFRPYATYRGGVEREPWHLSYAPLAAPALAALTLELLRETIGTAELLGKESILAELPEIYARYVANVAPG
ncbi:MAG TPA: M15 family metallopeptidase [Gammaproteobacteria bacterium]|nr:M15 family metallopeptidase [Gammaproteobacteria bacterium]